MGRVGPARASALPRRGPQRPVGSAGVTCLISTVDGLRRTPEIRQGGPRHGPRASLPASKGSRQRFPETDGSSLACSSPSGSSDGSGRTPEIRQGGQLHASTVSVPFRGFRGLQGFGCLARSTHC